MSTSTKRQSNANNGNSDSNSRSNSNPNNNSSTSGQSQQQSASRGRGGLTRGGGGKSLQRGNGAQKNNTPNSGTASAASENQATGNPNMNNSTKGRSASSSSNDNPLFVNQYNHNNGSSNNPQQPFVFQHHHQHAPFFQLPSVNGVAPPLPPPQSNLANNNNNINSVQGGSAGMYAAHHNHHQQQQVMMNGGNNNNNSSGIASNSMNNSSSSHPHHHQQYHYHNHQHHNNMATSNNNNNNNNNQHQHYYSNSSNVASAPVMPQGAGNSSTNNNNGSQYPYQQQTGGNNNNNNNGSMMIPHQFSQQDHDRTSSMYNSNNNNGPSGNPNSNNNMIYNNTSNNSTALPNMNNNIHGSPIVPGQGPMTPSSIPPNLAAVGMPPPSSNMMAMNNSNMMMMNSSNNGNGNVGNNNNNGQNMNGGQSIPLPPPGTAINGVPNPTYILNTANREGESQVFDFKNRPIDNATSGHLATFLNSISPSVSTSESCYGDGSDGETYYFIKEMLLAFRAPFGVPILMGDFGVALSESHPPEKELYYSPQLSGFKFELRTPEPPPINITLAVPAGGGGGPQAASNLKKGSKQASKTGTPTTTGANGMNFPTIEPRKRVVPEIIEWHEDAKPEMRGPLVNQFEVLCSLPQYERLRTLKNTECTVTSWFCVLWVPIHVKTHTPQASAGSFLVFYLVNPPANMPNSGYRKHDPTTFYFRADPFSVAPLEFLNAPSFARGVDAFAPSKAPREMMVLRPGLSEERLEKNSKKEEKTVTAAAAVTTTSKKKNGKKDKNSNDEDNNPADDAGDSFLDDDSEKIEVIIDPTVKMRVPIFGLIPCRISAEIWYGRYQYYAAQTGQIINSYAAPLFLLYTAMQLMNWEKSRVIQTYLDEGKNIMEANHAAVILPDYDHLMKHENRLNAFLNYYVV